MTNKLFLYYSHTGNGDAVAACLAAHGYDVRRIAPKKELPKPFLLKILQGGFQAGIGYCAKLKEFDADIAAYDKIVIGSPVWNGSFAAPVNSVLRTLDLTGKTVSFLLYAGGGTAPKAVKRIAKTYPAATVTVLREPKTNPAELEKIPL